MPRPQVPEATTSQRILFQCRSGLDSNMCTRFIALDFSSTSPFETWVFLISIEVPLDLQYLLDPDAVLLLFTFKERIRIPACDTVSHAVQ